LFLPSSSQLLSQFATRFPDFAKEKPAHAKTDNGKIVDIILEMLSKGGDCMLNNKVGISVSSMVPGIKHLLQ
jgi:hypothetical protein